MRAKPPPAPGQAPVSGRAGPELTVVAPYTHQAEHVLRAPGLFDWSTVTLLALVVYVYTVEIERSNWDAVLAGIAFWLMDWVNEIINALVLHFNGHAALWTVTGRSSFVILIGLNVETRCSSRSTA